MKAMHWAVIFTVKFALHFPPWMFLIVRCTLCFEVWNLPLAICVALQATWSYTNQYTSLIKRVNSWTTGAKLSLKSGAKCMVRVKCSGLGETIIIHGSFWRFACFHASDNKIYYSYLPVRFLTTEFSRFLIGWISPWKLEITWLKSSPAPRIWRMEKKRYSVCVKIWNTT